MSKRQWGELLTTRVQRWRGKFKLKQLSAGAKVLKLLLPGEAGTLDAVAQAIDTVDEALEGKPPTPKLN